MTTKSAKSTEAAHVQGSRQPNAAPAHARTQDGSRRIKISGLSEEFPAVVVTRRSPAASPYSRYHTRYRKGSKAANETLHPKKLPVFTWLCFFIYGAAALVATMVWFLLELIVFSADISAGSTGLAVGIIILGLIIAAGIILAAVTILISTHRSSQDEDTLNILATGIRKTAIVMFIMIAIWIFVMAFVASMA